MPGVSALEIIESVILRDCGRGVELLEPHARGQLALAAEALATATSVAVVTGFGVPTVRGVRPETDGPIGGAAIAAYAGDTGRICRLVTDQVNASTCVAALHAYECDAEVLVVKNSDHGDAVDVEGVRRLLKSCGVDLVVFIERLGPNAEGRYLSMRAVDLTDTTAPLDRLARDTWGTIGIGDGGNEIGMGAVPHDAVVAAVERGDEIHCRTPTDSLVLAGVSNWGGWALVAAAALATGDPASADSALSLHFANAALAAVVSAGAVDGVRLEQVLSVDGMEPTTHNAVLTTIRTLAGL